MIVALVAVRRLGTGVLAYGNTFFVMSDPDFIVRRPRVCH